MLGNRIQFEPKSRRWIYCRKRSFKDYHVVVCSLWVISDKEKGEFRRQSKRNICFVGDTDRWHDKTRTDKNFIKVITVPNNVKWKRPQFTDNTFPSFPFLSQTTFVTPKSFLQFKKSLSPLSLPFTTSHTFPLYDFLSRRSLSKTQTTRKLLTFKININSYYLKLYQYKVEVLQELSYRRKKTQKKRKVETTGRPHNSVLILIP